MCSRVGEELAQALHWLSFDVVGLIAGYVMYNLATTNSKPRQLLSFTLDVGEPDGDFDVHAIACDSAKRIWTTAVGSVLVYSEDGMFLFTAAMDDLVDATGVCIDEKAGEVFVVDYRIGCMVACRLDGSVVRKMLWSDREECGQLQGPLTMAADSAGLLYVCEHYGDERIRVFKGDGSFVRSLGSNHKFFPRSIVLTGV